MNKLPQGLVRLGQAIVTGQQRRMITKGSFRGSVTKPEVHPGYAKNKAMYERFQVDDGVPVHLKAGFRDQILYYATIGLSVYVLGSCMCFYYKMAYPKKEATS